MIIKITLSKTTSNFQQIKLIIIQLSSNKNPQQILQMSFFGVEINAQANRIVNQIRLTLQKNKYCPNFRTIYRTFVNYDKQVSGTVAPNNFQKALNENGIFFKKFEIQALQKAFPSDNNICWFDFMGFLRRNMNEYRSQVISKIFDFLDQKHEGKVHYSVLSQKFNPSGILEFQLGHKTKDVIQKELLGLVPLTQNGFITREQFFNFYNDLSVNISSDKVFAEFASSHWQYKLDKAQIPTLQQIKSALKVIRFKLIQRTEGTHQQFLLKQLFDQFDINKNGYLSEEELLTMLVKLQIPMEPRLVRPVMAKLDRNRNGTVEFDEFKNFLFFDPYPI